MGPGPRERRMTDWPEGYGRAPAAVPETIPLGTKPPGNRDFADDLREFGAGSNKAALASAMYPPGLAKIELRAGELHRIATDGEKALLSAGAPLFVRGGGLVRPIVDEMAASHGRKTKIARLATVDASMLVDYLSRSATWLKFNSRKAGLVATDPPLNVATTILSRDGEWRLRKLAGVITTPTLRPDGGLLAEPGYDAETRLLLLDPPTLPAMSEKPSRQEAAIALALLDKLLDGFPFVNEASRSVAISALITPIVRGAMPVAPLHATTAPVAGSGKSYIVDLASAIGTGDRAPVIAAGRNDEETEKRLGSALLAGLPIISIDNVNGPLGGDALCQMIERPVVSIRPLGVSKLVRIESRATTFATGNNIQLVGDMTRRVVLCSLDPDMERPELRVFRSNPLQAILADRGRYIAAALTVARAYIVAGRPGLLPALASYEEWSDCVRSALVWLGRADPVDTMISARADDPILSTLSGLVHSWHSAVGEMPFTAGQIKERAEERNPLGNPTNGDLHRALVEAAGDRSGSVNGPSLGRYLGRHKGRIVDGLKLVGIVDGHSKQNVWRVKAS